MDLDLHFMNLFMIFMNNLRINCWVRISKHPPSPSPSLSHCTPHKLPNFLPIPAVNDPTSCSKDKTLKWRPLVSYLVHHFPSISSFFTCSLFFYFFRFIQNCFSFIVNCYFIMLGKLLWNLNWGSLWWVDKKNRSAHWTSLLPCFGISWLKFCPKKNWKFVKKIWKWNLTVFSENFQNSTKIVCWEICILMNLKNSETSRISMKISW